MPELLVEHRADSVFNRRIRTLRSAGIELPDDCALLVDRLKAFDANATGTPCRDALVAAIAAGETDLATMTALALAEASPNRVDVFEAVRAELNAQVRKAYRQHAAGIYQQVADQFNTAAAAFGKAADVFDPEASAEAATEGTAGELKAWKASASAAAELTRLSTPLLSAALLARIPGSADNPAATAGMFTDRVKEQDLMLALCVDTTDVDRPTLWDAWDAVEIQAAAASRANQGYSVDVPGPRRCGRWSALREAGITIRAAALDAYQPYGRTEPVPETPDPEPIEAKPQHRPKGRIIYPGGYSIPVG